MPRANRHYIPGCVWHITHRCHKQEFLLKFEKDRKRWRHWLYKAKKRYGLCVLDYIITSNHVHLLVMDTGEHVIPKSLQLIAGRTAQEYNIRKKRKGAFWEDRYHATAVQTDKHLAKCLVYIDLNMVRAGVVQHPSEYTISGYNEIQTPPKRYSIVNQKALNDLFAVKEDHIFRQLHREWVEQELLNDVSSRQSFWSEAVAVGNENYIQNIQRELVGRIPGRSIISESESSILKEPTTPYSTLFDTQKCILRPQNTYFLSINH
ncbi:transposase [Desulfosediminicola flagellatus]|uniref:transposase n=1 Tax=Desulfosediminicola flagellatus TaxID=2569541 RepID=UPI0010AD1876|nr:transposase [Desulfosediminicola flagellatus]